MKASVCMATHDRPNLLAKTLESIYRQRVPFEFEVIVVDDGSTEDYSPLREQFPSVRWHRIDRDPGYRGPAVARNIAYRAATGEIIIAQSDDVFHESPDCIERLVAELIPGTCVFARVLELTKEGRPGNRLTTCCIRRPLFFLGSLYRSDLYAVGGNDEEFEDPSHEDDWFAACLIRGLGIKPVFSKHIIGYHQYHLRPTVNRSRNARMLRKKIDIAKRTKGWTASGGAWNMEALQ